MHTGRAFRAGVAGGAVMTGVTWMARTILGMPMNLEMMEGTMLVQPPGGVAWAVGLAMHLVISGLIGLVYAWGFERVTHRAGWLVGAGFGVVHAVIAGIMMGMVPAIHPLIPGQMPAPGAFLSSVPMGPVALFMLHVIYGAVVGAIYRPAEHAHDVPGIVGPRGVRT